VLFVASDMVLRWLGKSQSALGVAPSDKKFSIHRFNGSIHWGGLAEND